MVIIVLMKKESRRKLTARPSSDVGVTYIFGR